MKLSELLAEAKKRSKNMSAAIADLVRDEDDEALTDDEVRALGHEHKLTAAEIAELVEIAQDGIGY